MAVYFFRFGAKAEGCTRMTPGADDAPARLGTSCLVARSFFNFGIFAE